nr:hypothetical protein CFP56_31760 [Quercus suber]
MRSLSHSNCPEDRVCSEKHPWKPPGTRDFGLPDLFRSIDVRLEDDPRGIVQFLLQSGHCGEERSFKLPTISSNLDALDIDLDFEGEGMHTRGVELMASDSSDLSPSHQLTKLQAEQTWNQAALQSSTTMPIQPDLSKRCLLFEGLGRRDVLPVPQLRRGIAGRSIGPCLSGAQYL